MKRCSDTAMPIPGTGFIRICYLCQRVIGRHDKWCFDEIVIDKRPRRVICAIRHRHCDNPDGYFTREEYARRYGHEQL